MFQKVKNAAIHCQMPVAKYLKIAKQRGITLGDEVQLPEPKATVKAAIDDVKKKAATPEKKAAVKAPATATAAKKATAMTDGEKETKDVKGPVKRKAAPKPDVADVETPAAKPIKKARK